MKKLQHGYSLHELIISLAIGAILILWAGGVWTVLTGNFWFTEVGVLRAVQLSNPNARSVLDSTRNVYDDSEVLIEVEGQRVTYCVDSNLLFNYKITACNK